MASAVDVGQFDYSNSSSSVSSSSSVLLSHGSDPTPERRRGPAHHAPAAYFLSEGGISPGSHTAVYAPGVSVGRTRDTTPPNGANASIMDWSPSSSVSASTSPRTRGVGRKADGKDDGAEAANRKRYARDEASLSSVARSRSSSQRAPSARPSPRAVGPSFTSVAPTQFTLPTLQPLRGESEPSAAVSVSRTRDAASPHSSSGGAGPPTRSSEPRRLSTTRSFDRPQSGAAADDPRSPPPRRLEVVVSSRNGVSPSPTPTGVRVADCPPSLRPVVAAAPTTSDVPPSSPPASLGEDASRRRRLGSPGHAATHSPHKRPLPAAPRLAIGELDRERLCAEYLSPSPSPSPSASQLRRSPSAQTGREFDYYSDDDAEREKAPFLSPPPKMRESERLDTATATERHSVGRAKRECTEDKDAESSRPPREDVTRDVATDEAASRSCPVGGVVEVRGRLSGDASDAVGNASANRAPPTQPRAPTATLPDNSAEEVDVDGVLHSPNPPSSLRPTTPRSGSRLPPREAPQGHSSAHPVSILTSKARREAAAWTPQSTSQSPSPSRSGLRSPPAASGAVVATREEDEAAASARLNGAKRRLRLHTVSADRGRSPSAHRSRPHSLEASLASSAVVENDSREKSRHRRQGEETSEDGSEGGNAVPLLLSILCGSTADAEPPGRQAHPAAMRTRGCEDSSLVDQAPLPTSMTKTGRSTSLCVSSHTPAAATAAASVLPSTAWRAIPFKSAAVHSSDTHQRGTYHGPRSASATPRAHDTSVPASTAAASTLSPPPPPQIRTGLLQRASAFRSSAIRPRGSSQVSTMDASQLPLSLSADARAGATATTPVPSAFDLEFIPYVRTRASPQQAQTAAAEAVASNPVVMMPRHRRTRPPPAGSMNDSATSPIALPSQMVPSSLWSSYQAGVAAQSESGLWTSSSPQPREPDQASRQPTFQSTPTKSENTSLCQDRQRSPQLVSANVLTPDQSDKYANDLKERLWLAVEENRLITALLAQKKLLHAEACDREKVRLLEVHFWRSLQAEWFYHLAADRLVREQSAVASARGARDPSPKRSPPPSRKMPTKTAAAVERIMIEQAALADELQYLSGALVDLMAQHA